MKKINKETEEFIRFFESTLGTAFVDINTGRRVLDDSEDDCDCED